MDAKQTTVGNGISVYGGGKLVVDLYEDPDTGKLFVYIYTDADVHVHLLGGKAPRVLRNHAPARIGGGETPRPSEQPVIVQRETPAEEGGRFGFGEPLPPYEEWIKTQE